MKRYNLIKNIILASLIVHLYCSTIPDHIPAAKIMFGMAAIFTALTILLRELDDYFERNRYRRKMTEEQFARYQNWLGAQVEIKRAKGKDKAYLKHFVRRFISHDVRFSFSIRQRWKLLKLAKEGQADVA
ncbi:MAG: hypothetical protein IJ439_03750 [Tyzzerella sp.]|nr:hypothetical protein [Tyzzerella sp.]